ncbi:MAG: hypothetical protein DRG31_00445 [Deltaproteobacteria bacterium]|nr:MAG: hypothetical protein DRG31_00445 [Deltaproteobacteria bacterium]
MGERFIYLLFRENLDEVDTEAIRLQVEEEFLLPTRVQKIKIDLRPYFDANRRQFHSTMILKGLLKKVPPKAEKALLIVDVDLFIPILTFVFGEAQLGGKVGIVSLARLRQEFYSLPPNLALLHRRLIKEIKHELGHTFGLIHCSQRECVMSVAHNVLAVDQKGMGLCRGCKDFLLKALKR